MITSDLSLLTIAAALLTQFILAQHIGLRALNSLRETIGISATIICTLPIAAIFDWLFLHTVLQPFDIVYLRLFIGVILTAALAPLVEAILRSRFASWFPPAGSFLPLTMTTCCTLIAAQIIRTPDLAFLQLLFSAIELSLGAVFLLVVLQALRNRHDAKPMLIFNLAAYDVLHAVFIFVALRGILSIWQ